jgi:glycogenin
MSEDTRLFQPPESYPEAPKDMYYQVPSTKPEPKNLRLIFPWEGRAPVPTRVFAEDAEPEHVYAPSHAPRSSAEFAVTPSIADSPQNLWQSFSLSNAWDEVPEIERYIEAIQKSRRGNVQVITGSTLSGQESGRPDGMSGRRASTRITDFPTEAERPSLPVTPAPIRRTFWSQNQESSADLPVAEGVPSQEDWVRLTVDVFLDVLRAVYLYWNFTESSGAARRTPMSADRVSRNWERLFEQRLASKPRSP